MAKIQDLKIEELKQELEKRNLATSGRKVELLSRLREAMEKEGIDVDKHDFHRRDDEASLKDKDKEEVAGSSNDVEQTSAKLEEQGKAPCASTAIDMNMLLGAISQISSQLQVQETRMSSQLEAQKTYMSSQLDEKITQLQENLFKDNAELRERQDKIEERQDKIEALIKEKQDKVEAKDELEDLLRGLQ
ncbi:PREDICTED: SAFB-like transcription modulator [Rhagoletis zephyria]|uniref:SAFB-like transcription modulator n=1 Tax=Rhagoletis zephyria TaxID=28612 RepID=UPI000811823C|nr:PREDICTED: SAFB-like transcription modulator [Rhagoletis zephyria]